ncbi:unnamed protein product [Rhizopus stolonifer]
MVVAPVIGYVDQYFIIKRNKSSAGFNLVTCGILLSANILRIFFWLGKRFDNTLLFQSILMILSMLILLEIAVRYKRDHPVLYTELRASFSSSDIDRDLEAEANGYEQTAFWHWEHYLNYIITLLVFTTLVALFYLIFNSYSSFIEILGALSLGIESTLPLPQCISNFKNRSTQGFSLLVLASWFLGDGFKLFYFIFTDSPTQFVACGSIQLFIDTLIVIECIVFSSSIKQRFSENPWINSQNELLEEPI